MSFLNLTLFLCLMFWQNKLQCSTILDVLFLESWTSFELSHTEKRMPDHPLHKHLQDLTKNRLKRTSLDHVLKEQQRKQSDILAPRPEECEMLTQNRTPAELDSGLHQRISWKCYKKWRMWHLHQTAKQASHYFSNTGWRSVLNLQSKITSTPHRDRDCHPVGDKNYLYTQSK